MDKLISTNIFPIKENMTPSSGQVISFNTTTGKWENITLPAGATPTTDASQLTSGTLPDARLSSAVALLTGTQTLTNKTISGASNTISNIAQASIINLTSDLASKEPVITSGTTLQYLRGDKSLATLNADVVPDGTTNKAYTSAEKTKLSGIATGATSNSTDAQLRDRSTHTGTQVASTVVEDATHRFSTDTEKTAWNAKQAALVSGTNIRTVNGLTLLGSTDIVTPLTTDASQLTTGILLDARLSTNVDLIAATQTLTNKTISGATNTITAIPESAIINLVSDLASKEPSIAAGTTSQYRRGDKTWQTLNSDAVIEGITNLYISSTRVLGYALTGIVFTTNRAITATDSLLVALGLLQRQITDNTTSIGTKEPAVTSGTTTQYYRGDKSFQTLNQDVVADGTTNKAYSSSDKTKLAGIATGATANSTDAQLRDRSTHTGTQTVSTITGLATSATTDTTQVANITDSATKRFTSDTEKTTWNAKQASLVSGTNIKTINGVTVLGSGDLVTIDTFSTLTYAVTVNLDFSLDTVQALSLTGNVTFTTSNRIAPKSKVIRLICDTTARTLTFPTGWIWLSTIPTSITASKNGILSIECFGTTDTTIVASYKEQI